MVKYMEVGDTFTHIGSRYEILAYEPQYSEMEAIVRNLDTGEIIGNFYMEYVLYPHRLESISNYINSGQL